MMELSPALYALVPVCIGDDSIEVIDQVTYLGSVVHWYGRSTAAVKARIAKASKAFDSMLTLFFRKKTLKLK